MARAKPHRASDILSMSTAPNRGALGIDDTVVASDPGGGGAPVTTVPAGAAI
jgi:hypothetical protein